MVYLQYKLQTIKQLTCYLASVLYIPFLLRSLKRDVILVNRVWSLGHSPAFLRPLIGRGFFFVSNVCAVTSTVQRYCHLLDINTVRSLISNRWAPFYMIRFAVYIIFVVTLPFKSLGSLRNVLI